MNKIEILNKLLKLTYQYGYKVGYAWYDLEKFFDVNGHLKNETKCFKEIKSLISNLLDMEEKELNIYFIEDKSVHEGDWDYISPTIERRK